MTQHETHIEIMQDEEETMEAPKHVSIWKNIIDLEGWKKDLKKIIVAVCITVIIFAVLMLTKKALAVGVRFQAPIKLVSYERYSHLGGDFSFSFSKGFVFDGDKDKKYGQDYLAGFYLNADQRTGCDVRLSSVGINFAKSDQEINDAISKDLSAHVRGFSGYQGKRIMIDGKNAMRSDFSLTDPLNNVLEMTQVMVTNGNKNYLITCGSGQSQRKFFQEDFDDFISSFQWGK